MADRLQLKPRHRRVLEEILPAHVPGIEAWAHGSRVNGHSHGGAFYRALFQRNTANAGSEDHILEPLMEYACR